nr:MAG: ORF1 [TTV-like mini virus]
MPAFYRRWRWRRRQPWRRRYFTRRFRKPLRRKLYRRRHWVRRRLSKRHYKKKLKNIKLRQWQPTMIRKCNIKGHLCLFTCGKGRINHNYILTSESIVPTGEPGGGGWAIMQLTLGALWDEHIHFRNWWTSSNQGLPLCRYVRCTFKFYKSKDTAYIVTPQLYPPFEVTRDTYLNTQPLRHLMNRKSFIVPKRQDNKKPYVRKKFNPPNLLMNKWYFQQDLLNQPLIILHITACSFSQPYAPKDQISTNITLITLNTNLFKNCLFDIQENAPYMTSITGTTRTCLYTEGNGTQLTTVQNSIPLWETEAYREGQKVTSYSTYTYNTNGTTTLPRNMWGNPFHYRYHHPDVKIYYGPFPTESNKTPNVSLITSLFDECRYNPFKDKAKGNTVYLKPTHTPVTSIEQEPTDENLKISDFPLWLIFWGWIPWLFKSKPIHHIYESWFIVVKSEYITPKKPCYVFLDHYFTHPPEHSTDLTETDKTKWHPRYEYQEYSLEEIAKTGPFTPKIVDTKQIQADCLYNFYFKWGGCPAPMETITNPAEQERYPIPNYFSQGPQTQDPATPKQHYLYDFDEQDELITKKTAKRLKRDYAFGTYFTDYGPKDIPQRTQEKDTSETETDSPQKTKTQELQQQLQLLNNHKQQLKQRIRRAIKDSKLFPQK